ncbi:hypothetical protein Tco_1382986 [Tanacetum coccineum]
MIHHRAHHRVHHQTSSNSSTNALSDSASSRSSSDHSLPTSPSGTRSIHHLCLLVASVHRSSAISERPSRDSSSASPSRKRSRSLATFVPLSSPTLRALSYAHVDLLPSSGDSYGFRGSRGTNSEIDVDVKRSDGIEIDPKVQAEIDECMTGPVKVRVDRVTHLVVADDIPEPAQEGAVEVTYETLGDLVQRFHDHTEEILVHRVQLERDNKRLRDMMDVASQRVTRSQPRKIMPNTRSGASRTRKGVNEQINRQMAGALGARTTARNLEPLMRDGGGQEEVNRGNGNGRNGNEWNGN